MVKNLPPLPETWVQSLDWEDPLEKEMATHFCISWEIQIPLSLQGASLVAQTIKSPPAMEDFGSVPELGRSPGGGHGNQSSYSSLENPHGQRSLAGCSPWGRKELDVTELSTHVVQRSLFLESFL